VPNFSWEEIQNSLWHNFAYFRPLGVCNILGREVHLHITPVSEW